MLNKKLTPGQVRFNQHPEWNFNNHELFNGCLKFPKAEAIEKNQFVYWSNSACIYGHIGWVYTHNETCVHCARAERRKARHVNRLRLDLNHPDPNRKAKAIREIEKRKDSRVDPIDKALGWV